MSSSKKLPPLESDELAEKFVEIADLSEYDLSDFQPMIFEFAEKDTAINLRVPSALLSALKQKAQLKGIPYTRYIRLLIEQDLHQSFKKTI
ncbi:BrnA antitoxin family protein [Pelistega suis]|uniref:BrnA antitoxin family protein n=1 Tax=Pelistega suis TaxID=1631957 RepID=UPI00211CB923|nr:BrnA antitoxin family protein [Pelistega suis]MCQ9328517.1 BrnA antitoxin family protein [Pelistega suis]